MGRWYNTTFMGLMVAGDDEPTYADKVLGYGPIAYWPLWEAAGGVANCLVNPLQDGAYTGVTLGQPGIGDGNTSPYFDGAIDYANIYSVALNTAWNGDEYSIAVWCKVLNAAVWADPTVDEVIRIAADGNNYVAPQKMPGPNQFRMADVAGGAFLHQVVNPFSDTEWFHIVHTHSLSSNEIKLYINAVQQGVTLAGLAAWAGALSVTTCCIGAQNTVPNQPWNGWIAHAAVWAGTILTQPQITDLATI